jgi:DNA repair exonuclease SbcCD ATPase subunit
MPLNTTLKSSMSNKESHPYDTSENPEILQENSPLQNQDEETLPMEIADSEEESSDKKTNPYLNTFLQELEKQANVEAKIKYALEFMEGSLAQSGTPHFKSFWEVRNVCLQLFKENIPPALRAQFWIQYSDLSKEARRLKELLDEQSSFAVEQIEIAISALENEIKSFEENVSRLNSVDLTGLPKSLQSKKAYYVDIQNKLNLLNVQASRINALRKELIKTEMRVRHKNKFFQRLSQAGDAIFPIRKDLIKDLSKEFSQDVENFIQRNFRETAQDALFTLREDIKGLQGIAKILTLNTQSFTQTRLQLSECWDKLKTLDKERKKERAQQKVVFKENHDAMQERITKLKEEIDSQQIKDNDAFKEMEEISKAMRGVELGREEIKSLKNQLSDLREPLLQKEASLKEAREQQENEKEKARREKVEELKLEVSSLAGKIASLNVQELIAAREEINDKLQNSQFSKFEKQEVERLFKPLRSSIADLISEKEEESLLSLSEDDRNAMGQLKEVLKQRKERRQEIKQHLDSLRKSSGSSGLDFEKAMNNVELVKTEKERLEKINQGIKEIEDKISQLQKRK